MLSLTGCVSSPFKVLLLLRKVVRCRNFLRTWLPRRKSLIGADIQTRWVSQNQNTREPKKEISWLRTHGTLPSRGHLLAFLGLLFLSRPLLLATDHLPWSFFFLTSPSCGDRPALAELNGFHVRDLVCGSSEKKILRFLDL